MTNHALDPALPLAHLNTRKLRIARALDRSMEAAMPSGVALSGDQIGFLVREAEDLYWNELAWEEMTNEERVAGGHLTELVFPGFLALIDGLLFESTIPSQYGSAHPHPEVVDEILLFLARRYSEATAGLESGADSERLVWTRALTAHLIDLVLYRLYGLTTVERECLDNRG
jgi:hypothetical protein